MRKTVKFTKFDHKLYWPLMKRAPAWSVPMGAFFVDHTGDHF